MVRKHIKFPQSVEDRRTISREFYSKYGIPGVIGCIDCTHIKIVKPRYTEEHIYYSRKYYSFNDRQMICDSTYRILNVNSKYKGSNHDSFIWQNSQVNEYIQGLHRSNEMVWLLGDSGYPQRPWLMTPYLDVAEAESAQGVYNHKHVRARVVIGNTFGRLKNRWRCLCKDRVLHYGPTKAAQIIQACCVLHNMAIDFGVPDPEGDQDQHDGGMAAPEERLLERDGSDLIRGRVFRDQLARRIISEQGVILLLVIVSTSNWSIFALAKADENSQVDVRAVFINCEPDNREGISADNEATRFEREELFKHSVLQDCNKKIALTVKIASEPTKNSGDEYIPIEHVFRGLNKRVRLLDPYVLRLRREIPLQAYKLRRMATVNGVLSNMNDERTRDSKDIDKLQSRNKRSFKTNDLTATTNKSQKTQHCDLENNTSNNNVCLNTRDKRHEHNIVIEDAINEEKYPRWSASGHFVQKHNNDNVRESQDHFYEKSRMNFPHDNVETSHNKLDNQKNRDAGYIQNHLHRPDTRIADTNVQNYFKTENTGPKEWFLGEKRELNIEHSKKLSYRKDRKYADSEEFDMYEIGNPDLLYSVQVQLFEKLTTPDGKTVWNDMTKGEPASVSTLSPEWTGQDMNIRYRPTEWIPREEFTLPLTSLCLLTPIPSSHINVTEAENIEARDSEKKYIVVPKEDIVGLEKEDNNLQKRDGNASNMQYSTEQDQPCRRHVMIRTSRAIFSSREDNLNIAMNGGEQYLTLPHRKPHHAQIDLEARADENQLVPIGSSGRIMTVVADSSRRTRTTLTIQVTNTGLAAAKFRAVARDCGPELDNIGETFSDSPILVPPRHTRNIRLNVPTEMPADVAHCFVSLVNDEEESVAVRDVTIKKGDRCFCVWHCECVCLNEDPKLLCREMTEARQIAAGLSPRERVRHARSVCYHDVVSINMLVTALGVILSLLFFGLVKGCLGLIFRCIGSWGLHRIVQMPRKLDHYYESSLRGCSVVYDDEGWPVHPSTKERTVQLVSKPMEFILNVIFFVTTPCLIIYNILKEIYSRCCKRSDSAASNWKPCEKDQNCYSSHDIQDEKRRGRRRRRRHAIKKWMTPAAEDLSSNIWQRGLTGKTTMLPLLQEDLEHRKEMAMQPCVDSEGDDTEYVLMQMQKSKESLARSQRKLNDSEK